MDNHDDGPLTPEQEAWTLAQIKQRRSRLEAKPIGSVVRRLMTKSGYGQTQATSEMQKHWAAAVGPVLAERSRPGNLSRGVLLVYVSDSGTMQELYFCKRKIIASLQTAMPSIQLKDIRTRVTS
ncbi:DUF721 domain-containing protein [Aureliella helgolandensis]|uniref:DUF721 domain-containing protein n=1 Tax=Aureliella helgolandensis TaxID=2527968 RepID=A0A518G987_9BACT|nr:DUF721 domain-containing protein [Aureliella helgolandensis]QDV25156.1 hypothetical protein Q31a_34790 [Aureliella helgolandensis]